MLTRMLLLAALIPACRAAEARPESRATLAGTAQFPTDLPTTDHGTVRLTIRGSAEVSDDCKTSSNQNFVATYDGELVVQPDGQFNSSLYPTSPTVALANGCSATQIHNVNQVTSIAIDAQLGDEVGHGGLTYQNLAAVDGDELNAGAFDELVGELTFTRQ
jgi:hypothetical protein